MDAIISNSFNIFRFNSNNVLPLNILNIIFDIKISPIEYITECRPYSTDF